MWKARNALFLCGENWAEQAIIEKACVEWQEWKSVQQKESSNVVRRVLAARQKCWEKPDHGVIKINVTSDSSDGCGGVGLGVVARDDQGQTIQM